MNCFLSSISKRKDIGVSTWCTIRAVPHAVYRCDATPPRRAFRPLSLFRIHPPQLVELRHPLFLHSTRNGVCGSKLCCVCFLLSASNFAVVAGCRAASGKKAECTNRCARDIASHNTDLNGTYRQPRREDKIARDWRESN